MRSVTALDVVPSALQQPAATTVARRPGSIRRTSHVDMRPQADGGLVLEGMARDLVTTAGGAAVVPAEATAHATLAPDKRLLSLDVSPRRELGQLLGVPVATGFRALVAQTVPEEVTAASPLHLLLDDLPVAALISGYLELYQPDRPERSPAERIVKSDICSGWRSDGTMMVAIGRLGRIPIPVGPAAPRLESPDDDLGWHAIGPLPAGAMRRRRRVDVRPAPDAPGGSLVVDAMFRDTYTDAAGHETVLHEYRLDLSADPTGLVVHSVAEPRVLPWTECPAAAASAGALVGHRLDEVRDVVRVAYRGTSTCTHLNDLLRSLGDVPALWGELTQVLG